MSELGELITPVILAGGMGVQLQDVWDGPSVLVPVDGRPFVTHTLDRLVDAGFRRVVMVVEHRGAEIEDTIGAVYHRGFTYQTPHDLEIDYVYQNPDVSIGTGGTIRGVVDQIETQGILLVMDGNTYNNTVLRNFWEWFRRARVEVGPLDLGLQATRMTDTSGWDIVDLDSADGVVVAFCSRDRRGEEQWLGWVSTRMYLVPRTNIIERIPAGVVNSFEEDYIPGAIRAVGALGYRRLCKVLDIRTAEGLEKTRQFFA